MRSVGKRALSAPLVGLLVAILALTGCVQGGIDSDTDNTNPTIPDQLDCIERNYPCSWSAVAPEAATRTDNLLRVSAGLLSRGDTAEQIAKELSSAPDIVDLSFDALGVMFRVDGGIPVTVDVDQTEGGQLLSGGAQPASRESLPSLAQLSGVFNGCATGRETSDGKPGVTRAPGEDRHALLLSPWQFGLDWDLDTLRDYLQLSGSKYKDTAGGSVLVKSTPASGGSAQNQSPTNVVPADFCGWEAFDTIILMTHGRALCKEVTGSVAIGCLTSFSVGQYSETEGELRALFPDARGISVGVGQYGTFRTDLTPAQWESCHDIVELVVFPEGAAPPCFQLLPVPTVTVKVTSDFFRQNYQNGLPDRLIFLAACQGMKFGEMGTILGKNRGTGQILGFSRVTALDHAQALLEEFTKRLGDPKRIGSDYKEWANNWLDDARARGDVWDYPLSDLPGGEWSDLDTDTTITAWGSDIVAILSDGEELVDGGSVQLIDPPPNSGVDTLDLTLELADVEENEDPNDFRVSVLWNDQQVSTGDLQWLRGSDTRFTADAEVALPRKLEPGEKFDLEIRAELPAVDGAPTLWRYEDVTVAGSDWCSRLTESEVSSALGVAASKIETGDLGSFFGGFCAWATADESSQVSMLVTTGDAGSFRGTWANSPDLVDGFGDVAVYDPSTGRGDDCSSITDRSSGVLHWVCFVNLNVAAGNDVLRFTLEGNVVGENGPDGALDILRKVVRGLR